MIESATGLILRTRRLTETSLIVHWLTPQLGRIATVAKGARRPKSPFQGKLDLFYEADFSFSRSRRSELHTLGEIKLLEIHTPLRRELGYLQQASYCASLIEQATETETPLPTIYQLMRDFLAILPQQPPQSRLLLAFELKLLAELGLKPDLTKTRLSAGTRKMISALGDCDWQGISRLVPSAEQTVELREFLHGFLIFHLGKIPRHRGGHLVYSAGLNTSY
ncbi:MAG TPA: DNA repair protein RecO [Verrucomicrobiae bacterium]|nr:DNA repair protein RecO [Verrucomicrobiae bacterium]